jgi:hypothetical protein
MVKKKHKGFRVFRALSPGLILGGNFISFKTAISYDTIHSPLECLKTRESDFYI